MLLVWRRGAIVHTLIATCVTRHTHTLCAACPLTLGVLCSLTPHLAQHGHHLRRNRAAAVDCLCGRPRRPPPSQWRAYQRAHVRSLPPRRGSRGRAHRGCRPLRRTGPFLGRCDRGAYSPGGCDEFSGSRGGGARAASDGALAAVSVPDEVRGQWCRTPILSSIVPSSPRSPSCQTLALDEFLSCCSSPELDILDGRPHHRPRS